MTSRSSPAVLYEQPLQSPEDTHKFAKDLADMCEIGDCLLLYGEVGAGKTTFARGFIQRISDTQDDITSPTFTLVQTYPLVQHKGEGDIMHCDLYRLEHQNELHELGIEDALDHSITLIEWPELIADQIPQAIHLFFTIAKQERNIIVKGNSDIWKDRISHLTLRKNT